MYINGTYDILISELNTIILISGQFIVVGCRICVLGNWVIFGLSICSGPFLHEGMAYTNTDISSTRPFLRNLSEICTIIQDNL